MTKAAMITSLHVRKHNESLRDYLPKCIVGIENQVLVALLDCHLRPDERASDFTDIANSPDQQKDMKAILLG